MTTAKQDRKGHRIEKSLNEGSESTEIMFKKSFEVCMYVRDMLRRLRYRLYIYVTGFGIEFFWERPE